MTVVGIVRHDDPPDGLGNGERPIIGRASSSPRWQRAAVAKVFVTYVQAIISVYPPGDPAVPLL